MVSRWALIAMTKDLMDIEQLGLDLSEHNESAYSIGSPEWENPAR